MSNFIQTNKHCLKAYESAKATKKKPLLVRFFNTAVSIGRLLVKAYAAVKGNSSHVSVGENSSIKLFENSLTVNIIIHNSPDNS